MGFVAPHPLFVVGEGYYKKFSLEGVACFAAIVNDNNTKGL